MKLLKAILAVLFPVAGAFAQSVPPIAPRVMPNYTVKGLMTDSLISKSPLGMLNPKSYLSVSPLNQQHLKQELQAALNSNTQTFYSRMPVAGLSSADKMPVAKRSGGTYHTMPVKRYKVIDPLTVVDSVRINP